MSNLLNYFKVNKTANPELHRDESPKTINESFYQNALAEQMSSRSDECFIEKNKLKLQISETKAKVKKIQEAIQTAREIVCEKNNKITELNSKLSPKESDASHQSAQSDTPRPPMFATFDDVFDNGQLTKLRSFELKKGDDSPFVRQIVQFLYSENLELLKTKTVCGRNYKGAESKAKMTPEKHQTVEKVFAERLSQFDSTERGIRFKRLNRLLKDAFANISKAEEMKNIEKKTCQILSTTLSEK